MSLNRLTTNELLLHADNANNVLTTTDLELALAARLTAISAEVSRTEALVAILDDKGITDPDELEALFNHPQGDDE